MGGGLYGIDYTIGVRIKAYCKLIVCVQVCVGLLIIYNTINFRCACTDYASLRCLQWSRSHICKLIHCWSLIDGVSNGHLDSLRHSAWYSFIDLSVAHQFDQMTLSVLFNDIRIILWCISLAVPIQSGNVRPQIINYLRPWNPCRQVVIVFCYFKNY